MPHLRRSAVTALLVAITAVGCAGRSSGSDVLLSAGGAGADTFLLHAEREPLTLQLSRPETPEADDERVAFTGEPSLDDAVAFRVVDEAEEMTIVAGPVPADASRVTIRSGLATSEASVVRLGDRTLFVARLVGHVDYDSIAAFDDEGAPVDVTDER